MNEFTSARAANSLGALANSLGTGVGLKRCTSSSQPTRCTETQEPMRMQRVPVGTRGRLGPGSRSHWVGTPGQGNGVRGRVLFLVRIVLGHIFRGSVGGPSTGSKVGCKESRGSRSGKSFIGKESELATSHHQGSKVAHKWVRLEMEIAQHLIRAPATHKFDDISVDLGTQ